MFTLIDKNILTILHQACLFAWTYDTCLFLLSVMSMGFSEGEARLGLRACDGNVQSSVTHIIKRREVTVFLDYKTLLQCIIFHVSFKEKNNNS